MSRVNTSRAAIARYWLGSEEGRRRYPANPALIDFGEPHCFACGDAAQWPAGELWSLWNRSGLERCHLVPRMLDGPDEPENLVLLCSGCHRDAPDVGDPNYMLDWMAKRESGLSRSYLAIVAAIEDAGLREDLERLSRTQPERLKETIETLAGTWIGLHGPRVTDATMGSVAVETIRRAMVDGGDQETGSGG